MINWLFGVKKILEELAVGQKWHTAAKKVPAGLEPIPGATVFSQSPAKNFLNLIIERIQEPGAPPRLGLGLNGNETLLGRGEKLQFGSLRYLFSSQPACFWWKSIKGAQGWIPAKNARE